MKDGLARGTLVKGTLGIIVGCLVVGSAPLEAQERWLTPNVRAEIAGAEPPPATVSDLSWISGFWEAETPGGRAEEIWAPPAAGAMVGMFRLFGDAGTRFYEILTLTEEGGSVVLRLKHFDPDLTGWEEKDEVEAFRLVELTDDAAFFAGLTFRRTAPDRMDVFVANEQPAGPTTELVFEYRRREGPVEARSRPGG